MRPALKLWAWAVLYQTCSLVGFQRARKLNHRRPPSGPGALHVVISSADHRSVLDGDGPWRGYISKICAEAYLPTIYSMGMEGLSIED